MSCSSARWTTTWAPVRRAVEAQPPAPVGAGPGTDRQRREGADDLVDDGVGELGERRVRTALTCRDASLARPWTASPGEKTSLHPFQAGLHQRCQLGEGVFGQVGQRPLQVRPDQL